jgi:hypothetical protein
MYYNNNNNSNGKYCAIIGPKLFGPPDYRETTVIRFSTSSYIMKWIRSRCDVHFMLDFLVVVFFVEITTFRKLAMLSSSGENKRLWNVISRAGCTGLSRYPAIIQHSKLRNSRFYVKKEAEIAVNGCTVLTKNC